MTGRVSFIEIGASDPQVAGGFLSKLFDWKFTPMGEGGNGWFQTPEMRAGLHPEPGTPGIYVFFSAPDLEAAIARVVELGGHVDKPIQDEPGFGRFCFCRTPDGLQFGLHQT